MTPDDRIALYTTVGMEILIILLVGVIIGIFVWLYLNWRNGGETIDGTDEQDEE